VVSKEDYKLGSFAAGLDNYFRITGALWRGRAPAGSRASVATSHGAFAPAVRAAARVPARSSAARVGHAVHLAGLARSLADVHCVSAPASAERNSTFGTEFTGGMTTFFSMCYIMARRLL
jgi:hypothetical protein